MEIWKNIPGYENLYQVSNYGNIKTLSRIIIDKTGKVNLKIKERLLKLNDNGNGYKSVGLCKNGKRKVFYIHRLVAELFLENINNLREVNHKDLDKSNNNVDNLEWVTSKGNKEHYLKTIPGKEKSKKAGSTRFKNVVAGREQNIIEDYNNNNTIKQIAIKYKLNPATITKVLKQNNITINANKKCYRKIKRDKRGRFIKNEQQ